LVLEEGCTHQSTVQSATTHSPLMV
jgi:hypothetical protein